MNQTDRILKSLKPQPQKQTPIMTGMFLPNKSGIFNDLKAGKISGEGSSITGITLDQLDDVETSGELVGDIFYHDGTTWTHLDRPIGFGNHELRNTPDGEIAWDSDVTVTDSWGDILAQGNTSSGNNPTLSTTDKLLVRDTGIFLHSPTDGDLLMQADDTITISGANVIIPKSNNWKIGAVSAVRVSHTGDTVETVIATITIPAGTLGANGGFRLTWLGNVTNSANSKTFRVRINGLGSALLASTTVTTQFGFHDFREVFNRNSASAQVWWAGGNVFTLSGVSNPSTGTINTDTTALNIVFTVQLTNAAETGGLEYYMLEYMKGNTAWE